MKKIIPFIILFFCSNAQAELWVKHNSGTFERKYHGDCKTAGFCDVNNTNIQPGWIEVTQDQFDIAGRFTKVVAGNVVAMSQAEIDAINAQDAADAQAALLSSSRSGAKDSVDQLSPEGVRIRAALLVTLDEINNLRQWIEAFKAQVALASNLADLKTRVASLPSMPDRTTNQVKTAIKGKIDAGSAD